MEKFTETKEFEKVRVPEGIYKAEFQGMEYIKEGAFGPMVAFEFCLSEGVHKGKILSTIAYKKWGPNTRATKIVKKLGIDYSANKSFDPNTKKGCVYNIVVEDYKNPDNNDVTSSIASIAGKV